MAEPFAITAFDEATLSRRAIWYRELGGHHTWPEQDLNLTCEWYGKDLAWHGRELASRGFNLEVWRLNEEILQLNQMAWWELRKESLREGLDCSPVVGKFDRRAILADTRFAATWRSWAPCLSRLVVVLGEVDLPGITSQFGMTEEYWQSQYDIWRWHLDMHARHLTVCSTAVDDLHKFREWLALEHLLPE